MTRTILKMGVAMVLVAIVFGCGRNESDKEKPASPRSESSLPIPGQPPGKPGDFFPSQVGWTWTYEITIGDAEPLRYNETAWPLGDKWIVYATRRRFPPVVKGEGEKTFHLVIRSKATATKQGPLEYPIGIELDVVEDELGVYEDAKQVFWAISTSGRFMAHLVTTYDPRSAPGGSRGGAWGRWGQEEGYSMRLIFFGDQPGTQIGMGNEPADKLLFEGIDTNAEGYAGQPLLRFIRSVEGSRDDQSDRILDRAFTEEMWYAKGKGLVRLVQKVEGKTSMTWTLTALSRE